MMRVGTDLALASRVRSIHERLGDFCAALVRPDSMVADLRADAASLKAEVDSLAFLTRTLVDNSVDSPSGDASEETETELPF